MISGFLSDRAIAGYTWQALERAVCRLLIAEGFSYAKVVGQSNDGGADVVAVKDHRRWLVQVKRWAQPVGVPVLERTVAAMASYGADVGVVACTAGFTLDCRHVQADLARQGISVQLWDRAALVRRGQRLAPEPPILRFADRFEVREYQERAVQTIVEAWRWQDRRSVLAVLATGLGKTFVAAEALRRVRSAKPDLRVLVLAHTNDLVYQLERAFWPFMGVDDVSAVLSGVERPAPAEIARAQFLFATRDSFYQIYESTALPKFDVAVVDECHHLGSDRYEEILDGLDAGTDRGPFLIGLTATPWRPDGQGLDHRFDGAAISIDLVWGLQRGFLSNVDYRMFTDNIDWERLRKIHGESFSPRQINKSMFIHEWDNAVLDRIIEAWSEIGTGARGIVFCGTVEHATRVADQINAIGFAKAAPIFSRDRDGRPMNPLARNRLLLDFADGKVDILTAVDVLNEGVDVPDVNLIVFQRVTHSRRIFVQQLGRGLRLAPNKKRVIVLDFVSDIRRFAAGLELERNLSRGVSSGSHPSKVKLGSSVTFRRATREDGAAQAFLAEWLDDLDAVQDAGEDVSVLRFPPPVPEEAWK